MPIPYLRRLTGKVRTQQANRHLACFLSFIAGAINAGGFLAVGQYTSHMSGIISAMADHLALGSISLMVAGFASLVLFTFGAACSAVCINWARKRNLHGEYALPLMLEAVLLLLFGLLGGNLENHQWLLAPATVLLLCFIMGLQNAIITKISKAEIRTTHMTGMVTDIGIELGKMFYWNSGRHDLKYAVHADLLKIRLLGTLVLLFFSGGFVGALGFKNIGFISTVPLAATLMALAIVPIADDLRHVLRNILGR
ncbi:Uncharacterized membrane protein YoaK, UPF0700 family [Collimonas sp. OK607]|nr:Uncharacterized membrane protein YoaK, UPF0700 family [Collimonas sp. OK607]